MITYSHVIINAALRRATPKLRIPAVPFLVGGFLPDVGLTLLSVGTFIYHRFWLTGSDVRAAMQYAFDVSYFQDPLWIVVHNLFHSPTLLLIGLALLWRYRNDMQGWRHWWFWLLAGCMSHSILDVLTHVDDGPVLFFPFDWQLRFHSPVSYWDPRHYGQIFGIFEHTLDAVLLLILLGPLVLQRWRARAS